MAVVRKKPPLSSILAYWRSAMLDSAQNDLKFDRANTLRIPIDEIRAGTLSRENVRRLEGMTGHKKIGNEEEGSDQGVILCLRTLLPEYTHGQLHATRDAEHIIGVLAFLGSDGRLTLVPDTMPWVNRKSLEPTESKVALASVEDIDLWLQAHPFKYEDWASVLTWSERLWGACLMPGVDAQYVVDDHVWITPSNAINGLAPILHLKRFYDTAREHTESITSPLLKTYCHGVSGTRRTITPASRATALSKRRGTMSPHHGLSPSQAETIAAYTDLREGEILAVNGPPGTGKTTLLQAIVATEMVQRAMAGNDPAVIVGTSANNQAVTNINDAMLKALEEGALDAIWAQRWIPDVRGLGLYFPSQRMAPEAIAKGYAVAIQGGSLRTTDWNGLPEKERDPEFVARARVCWADRFRHYAGQTVGLSADIETLRADMKAGQAKIDALAALHTAMQSHLHALGISADSNAMALETEVREHRQNLEDDVAALEDAMRALRSRERDLAEALDRINARQTAPRAARKTALQEATTQQSAVRETAVRLKAAIPEEGFVRNLLSGRSWQGLEKRAADSPFAAEFVDVMGHRARRKWLDQLTRFSASRDAAAKTAEQQLAAFDVECQAETRSLNGQLRDLRTTLASQQAHRDGVANRLIEECIPVERGLEQLDLARRAVIAAAETILDEYPHAATEVPFWAQPGWEVGPDAIDNFLDRSLRQKLFHLAGRYWEGRWILEAEKVIQAIAAGKNNRDYPLTGGVKGMEPMYRRWCMLTPCLIVTTSSLPKLFITRGGPPDFDMSYMTGYIDLLIFDEGGQIPPYQGAPGMALAAKAIVVGDVYQLEPIVSLTPGTDAGNAHAAGVLDAYWDEGGPIDARVVTASNDADGLAGSVMSVAQDCTALTLPETNVAGLFLSEHRRCRRAIIEICNDLVYGGRLRPMRPEPSLEPPAPALGWANVQGRCEKRGGSNANPKEAAAIVEFIRQNSDTWTRFYGKPLHEVVAVITPFSAQKKLLQHIASRPHSTGSHDVAKVTYGTVHALQGAERPIIIFSPTLDKNASTRFLNSKKSLLNVAISRARDSFLVIGTMDILTGPQGSSLGTLGNALLQKGDELPGVIGNWSSSDEVIFTGERISTPEGHYRALDDAIATVSAGEELVIVSPFLTPAAAMNPAILKAIEAALARRARVTVVSMLPRQPERNPAFIECLATLREAGASCYPVPRIHSKSLFTNNFIIEGSFNWLSVKRDNPELANLDTSWRLEGMKAREAIMIARQELEAKGVWKKEKETTI
jgi:hypothetical protein